MKKLISLFLSVSVVLLTACGKQQNEPQNGKDSAQLQTVVIASTGSDADIWRYIATLPETKEAVIKLEVKNFTDYVSMNTAVANKEIDVNALETFIRTQMPDAPMRSEFLEDQEWERTWMDAYEPIQIADKYWIVPEWMEAPEPDAVNIKLDPGLAFGTGNHASTFLCLQWLGKTDVKDKIVIDYGCGSGILGVAALLLGAKKVYATDIDPQAILATEQNAALNGVAENLYVGLPDEFNLELADQKADVFVANILAGPLMILAPEFATLVKSEGEFALAGVIEEQVSDVSSVYSEFFDILEVEKRDENWCRISGKRHTL